MRQPSDVMSLVYVIGTYPLLTTTFVDREIAQMRARGVRVSIVSLRRPHRLLSQAQEAMMSGVRYVLPASAGDVLGAHLRFLLRRPVRLVSTILHLVTRPHPALRTRIRTLLHVAEGVIVADQLRAEPPDHLHAHFVDRAATVAWVCSRLLDIPFSATAHANDIYVDPVLLAEKAGAAKFLATCTEYNATHLQQVLGAGASKVVALHHGLDPSGFPPPGKPVPGAPLVLAVGQLKEKKGFGHLLDAARTLVDGGVDLRVVIAGGGPLHDELAERIAGLGLAEVVTLTGAVPHGEVLGLMQQAAVFVLPAVVAGDGDRDGIPNVILEAMAMELPVVSTRHSGIPEAVLDGETGLLVEPGDAAALASALDWVLSHPVEAATMGEAGRRLVAERFDLSRNVDALLALVRS